MAVNILMFSAWRTLLITTIFLSAAHGQPRAKLGEETAQAFDQYVKNVEKLLDKRSTGALSFLWLDENQKLRNQALRGRIPVEQLDEEAHIEGGLVHNWIGRMFIPDAKIEDVVAVFQDTTVRLKVE